MSDTISLWMTTPVIRSTPWKETVRGALRCYMRKRWRFDPTARPLIRIPCTDLDGIKHTVAEILTMVLGQVHVEPIFKEQFCVRARIIVASGKSIAKMLVNNIKFAKESSMTHSKCTCVELRQQFDIPNPLAGEHIAIRASTIKDEEAATIFAIMACPSFIPAIQHWIPFL